MAATNNLTQTGISAANSSVDPALTGVPSNVAPPVTGTPGAGPTGVGDATAEQQAAAGNQQTQQLVNPAGSSNTVTSANAGQDLNPVDTSRAVGQGKVNAAAGARNEADIAGAQSAPSTGVGGFLDKAGNVLEKHAGLATVAGNALSGMASGAAQQKAIEEQIAANQWGNMQWKDPTQVAKLQAAAGQPIGVPVGYLNRAAAVRNLMNTSGGGQTAPLSGQAPIAPTVKPVGM